MSIFKIFIQDQLQKTHARIEENEKKMVVLEKQRDSFKNRLEFFETQQPAVCYCIKKYTYATKSELWFVRVICRVFYEPDFSTLN